MNIPNYLKDKRFLIAGGVVVGVTLLYNLLKPSQPANITMTAEGLGSSNAAMLAQAAEVAIAGESMKIQRDIALQTLENERYIADAGITILKENNDTYLTGLEANNQFALASQVSGQDYAFASLMETNAVGKYISDLDFGIKSQEIQSAKDITLNEIGSKERMYRGDLSLRNIALSVQQTLGLSQNATAASIAQTQAQAEIELSRIAGDAQVNTAKASKTRSIGFGAFSLKF